MRRILCILIIIIIFLSGCGRSSNRFKYVEKCGDGYFVIVDTETGIAYLKSTNGGGITVMYDKDGEIYRPNGWRDYEH